MIKSTLIKFVKKFLQFIWGYLVWLFFLFIMATQLSSFLSVGSWIPNDLYFSKDKQY